MARFFAPLSLDDFKAHLVRAATHTINREEGEPLHSLPDVGVSPEDPRYAALVITNALVVSSGGLNAKMAADLGKIQFDFENCEADLTHCGRKSPFDQVLGFQVLPNGMACLGVMAGGDWEAPLYFVIYHDGQHVRAYLPEQGNSFNLATRTAYGSEDQVGQETPDQDTWRTVDPEAFWSDVQRRIQPQAPAVEARHRPRRP